jgi:hypothetical protein
MAAFSCEKLDLLDPAEQSYRKAIGLDAASPQAWQGLLVVLQRNPKTTSEALLEAHSKLFDMLDRSKKKWSEIALGFANLLATQGNQFDKVLMCGLIFRLCVYFVVYAF